MCIVFYLKKFKFYFMCTNVLSLCGPGHHVLSWCPQSTEESAGPLDPELQRVVSHHVGAGNGSWVSARAADDLGH